MIFEALQSELFRFNLHALSLKIPKIPEFNLPITYRTIFGGECGKMNRIEIVTAVGTENPPLSPNIYINRINISYLIFILREWHNKISLFPVLKPF